MELLKGAELETLLQRAKFKLSPAMPLLRLWMTEIFKAFRDILNKTIYMPVLPITLHNILIAEDGLK
jgi:hypothetical protein